MESTPSYKRKIFWLKFLLIIGIIISFLSILSVFFIKTDEDKEKDPFKIFHHLADSIALFSAVVAIYFAVIQKFDTENLQSNTTTLKGIVEDVAKKATEIADATSTKFLEIFPKNLSAICELIKNTNKELVILCDFAGYGHITNPNDFFEYRQLLERLAQKVKVILIVYNDSQAKIAMEEQLGTMNKANWPEFVEKLKSSEYAKQHEKKMASALESPQKFVDMIEENEKKTRRELRENAVKVGRTSKNMPFYLWMSDNREAIISYIALNPDAKEYAFHTKDAKLIEALNDVTKEFKEDNNVHWEVE